MLYRNCGALSQFSKEGSEPQSSNVLLKVTLQMGESENAVSAPAMHGYLVKKPSTWALAQ